MTLNVRDLPEQTWQAFYQEMSNRFDMCHSDPTWKTALPTYQWFSTPYFFTLRSVEAKNEKIFIPHHRILFSLKRDHPVMPFQINFTICVEADREDRARWSSYRDPLEAWKLLNIFTAGEECSFTWDWTHARPIKDFMFFLEDIDLALTRLAVHPERDIFLHHWQYFFDNRGVRTTQQYLQKIWDGRDHE